MSLSNGVPGKYGPPWASHAQFYVQLYIYKDLSSAGPPDFAMVPMPFQHACPQMLEDIKSLN